MVPTHDLAGWVIKFLFYYFQPGNHEVYKRADLDLKGA